MTLQKSKHLTILKPNLMNNFSSALGKNKKSVFGGSSNLSKNYYQKIVTYDLIWASTHEAPARPGRTGAGTQPAFPVTSTRTMLQRKRPID